MVIVNILACWHLAKSNFNVFVIVILFNTFFILFFISELVWNNNELHWHRRPCGALDSFMFICLRIRCGQWRGWPQDHLQHQRKRGKRGGIHCRLRNYGQDNRCQLPLLTTLLLSNVQSIQNKMDELEACARCKSYFRDMFAGFYRYVTGSSG